MTGFFQQVGLVLWKNFLIQRRKIAASVFEIISPLLLVGMLLIVRSLTSIRDTPDTIFAPQGLSELTSSFRRNTFAYAPDNPVVRGIMADFLGIVTNNSEKKTYALSGFEDENLLYNGYSKYNDTGILAVVFDNIDANATTTPTTVKYTFRPISVYYWSYSWRTDSLAPLFQNSEPGSSEYVSFEFVNYQVYMDQAIINSMTHSANQPAVNLTFEVQQMPLVADTRDGMLNFFTFFLPFLFCFSFIVSVFTISKSIIYEKERNLKESMKLMGLKSSANWLSWFLTSFTYLFISVVIFTIVLAIPVTSKGGVLPKSDLSVVFVFLVIYVVSIISFCFLITTFFDRANIGATAAGILYLANYAPLWGITYEDLARSQKLGLSLLSNTAMGLGSYSILIYEATGDGVQWNNIGKPAVISDNISLSDTMLMMLGDSAIYFLITWYVDNVFPGKYGVPKPFYFLFTRWYWCGLNHEDFTASDQPDRDSRYFEKDPSDLKPGIAIKRLSKTYKSGGKTNKAVDDMNLNIYQGQITVLLGHNGAGKTTTMSMLTGFIPPTSGTATVNGRDIIKEIEGVRESLGVCPQHNILFDTLTVDEHLEFFARLKGCKGETVKTEVERMAREIGLETKRTCRSAELSGGQKRKLSVGLALIGDSQVVILDEPTTGMDPAARRQIWGILQRHSSDRTILLTTHFMDEADVLGDRIAIMADGQVQCCGRSHFLKKLYGSGYHLVIVKSGTCNVQKVTEFIHGKIPAATLESELSAELSYLLPNEASSQFSALFQLLEQEKGQLGVNSFGVTATTMEEVFLKVGEGALEDINDLEKTRKGESHTSGSFMTLSENNGSTNVIVNTGDSDILAFNKGFNRVKGVKLELSRFYGMFVKKAIHTWRNKIISLIQILIPVASMILAMFASRSATSTPSTTTTSLPPIVLDLNPYDDPVVVSGELTSSNLTRGLVNEYTAMFETGSNLVTVTEGQASNISAYYLDVGSSVSHIEYKNQWLMGATFNATTSEDVTIRAMYNGVLYHSAAISVGYIMNAVARFLTGDSSIEIITTNHPFPVNYVPYTISGDDTSSRFIVVVCVIFGMSFLSSSFVFFLLKEKLTGAKHLQKVSGVGTVNFWLSNFVWDYINYLIPCCLILVVIAAFNDEALTSGYNIYIVFLVLLLYGLSILPCAYAFQFLCKSPPGGMAGFLILHLLTGIVTVITTSILQSFQSPDGDIVDWVFIWIFPHYNLGMSIMNIYSNHFYCSVMSNSNSPFIGCVDYFQFSRPGIGKYILVMLLQFFVFSAITLLIEGKIPQKIWYRFRPTLVEQTVGATGYELSQGPAIDEDVANEEKRIANMTEGSFTDSLVLKRLYKRFGNFVAVDRISVGIPDKECFGLLGQNGAGKTTAFKMLTGELMVTDGNAYLRSNDIKSNIRKVQENMGYCPQFDALIDQMTGRETLYMYGRLKGIPERCMKSVVNSLIDIMWLREHADKMTQVYSGGNKRKLSTAISLIGDPGFILLDEPTSGVDPKARRHLWNVLSRVRDSGKTLILTSHSMEECDALCTRVAIMVNGNFRCLGSPQHLKNRFGQGYTLICRMKTNEEDGTTAHIGPLVDFVRARFPSAVVFDHHAGYAHFQIPDNTIPLAGVFDVMESSKHQYHVEDYSVHQTTLEQVFLSFTGRQIPPREDKTGVLGRVCCC